jgi:hypothetical protein
MQILSLLARATSRAPDPMLPFLIWEWEAAWLPRSAKGAADQYQGLSIDPASFGHALHSELRPGALLPEGARPARSFCACDVARKRTIDAATDPLPLGVSSLFQCGMQFPLQVEGRHTQIREHWNSMLYGIGVETSKRHLVDTAIASMMRGGKVDRGVRVTS